MQFSEFFDLTERFLIPREKEFKIKVGGEIRRMKITPKRYQRMLPLEEMSTGLDWYEYDLENCIKGLCAGRSVVLIRAAAFYYLFHNKEPLFEAATNIDFFLFGKGVTFQGKFQLETKSALPSFGNQFSARSPSSATKSQRRSEPASLSVTELLFRINDLFSQDPIISSFFYDIDYEKFKFDPETFRSSDAEVALDKLLTHLSLVGGILRRGEINKREVSGIKTYVTTTLGNAEVQKYLAWLQRSDQLPAHPDFLDAVYLFERFAGSLDNAPALRKYVENADV